MNLYRCSKGIIKPEWNLCTKENAIDGMAVPTYRKSVEILDDAGEHLQTIVYEQYNTKRLSK
jgi:hypothetical protein